MSSNFTPRRTALLKPRVFLHERVKALLQLLELGGGAHRRSMRFVRLHGQS
jgi:hypothetical protein